MNRNTLAACAALLIAAISAGAQAQSSMSKTRDEVRQELVAAVRDGTIPRGELGSPMPITTGRTRAEVRAEFDAARQNGDLLAAGESSLKLNQLQPTQYPRPTVVAGNTRARVLAELAEAQRTGEMLAAGEVGLKLHELHPGAYPRASMSVYASAPGSQATR
jgi:hypothetical protein